MKALDGVHRSLLHLSLALVLGLVACGKEATGPEDTDDPGTQPPPQPPSVSVGVLLQGNSAAAALASLTNMMPTPAPEGEILGDLLASRLRAVLNPSATVAEVNAALVAQDVGIISMLEEHPFITLAMPPVASEAEADALAAALKASDAFVHVSPAFEFFLEPDEDLGMASNANLLPPPTGLATIPHLTASRFPAAWNGKALAPAGALPMTVVVPDNYYNLQAHNEIDCLRFEGGAADTRERNGRWRGNHGFHVAGIIGADFDGGAPTGTSPDPLNLLEIRAFSYRGTSWGDIPKRLYREIFPWGSPFVVNQSWGYSDHYRRNRRLDIAYNALAFRTLFSEVQDYFLIVNAAGNSGRNADVSGDARYSSDPNVAHHFQDLREVLAGAPGVSPQDSVNFSDFMEWTYIEHPEAASTLENVLIVGSSFENGAERPTSNRNSHLRAVGERVLNICAMMDNGFPGNPDFCDGSVARKSGTSMAAPIVAGLAAYLWNLDPSLSVGRVRQILLHAYNESNTPGLVDAYIAALSLDAWPNLGVRKALLDVAGDGPVAGADGRFDDNDIELFMNEFAAAQGVAEDWSRYDLNGDGFTGGNSTARFDLSVDWPPDFRADLPTMIGNDVVHFDERAVSDCDVLRYYAYTSLYEGDADRRRSLLLPCSGLDLGDFTRILLRVDINAVFEEADATRIELPGYSITAPGDGSIVGGVLDFTIDETYVYDYSTLEYSGLMSGSIDTDGGRIGLLQAAFDKVSTFFWTETETVTVVLQNLPLTSQNQTSLWYQVTGPETCASIDSVSVSWTWPTGSRTLVDYSCQESSQIWIQLVRMP